MNKGEKWIIFLLVVLNVVVIATVLEVRRRAGTLAGDVEKFKSKLDKFSKFGGLFK